MTNKTEIDNFIEKHSIDSLHGYEEMRAYVSAILDGPSAIDILIEKNGLNHVIPAGFNHCKVTILSLACQMRILPAVEYIISKGADVNFVSDRIVQNNSIVVITALSNTKPIDVDIILALVTGGADLNQVLNEVSQDKIIDGFNLDLQDLIAKKLLSMKIQKEIESEDILVKRNNRAHI